MSQTLLYLLFLMYCNRLGFLKLRYITRAGHPDSCLLFFRIALSPSPTLTLDSALTLNLTLTLNPSLTLNNKFVRTKMRPNKFCLKEWFKNFVLKFCFKFCFKNICRLLQSRNNVSTFPMILCCFLSISAIKKTRYGKTDGRTDGHTLI